MINKTPLNIKKAIFKLNYIFGYEAFSLERYNEIQDYFKQHDLTEIPLISLTDQNEFFGVYEVAHIGYINNAPNVLNRRYCEVLGVDKDRKKLIVGSTILLIKMV